MPLRVNKEEQLIDAVKEGDVKKVTELISKGADVNYRREKGQLTALDESVISGDIGLVNLLLDNGADVNSKTRNGYTALSMALVMHHPDLVDTLIRRGADVNAKSFVEQWTPLLIASSYTPMDESIVKGLVEAGGQINDSNIFGMTPLMYVAELGSAELVEYLLKKGADPRLVNKKGWSAIHIAASSTGESYLKAFESSINMQAKTCSLEVNFYKEGTQGIADSFSEDNRLVRPKVIRLLLEYGADIDAETTSGTTPLMAAIEAGNTEVAEVIIQYANINAGDETPLMFAVWRNRIEIVKLLIKKRAEVNHKKTTGENALEWAVFNGYDDIAKLLIEKGAKKEFSDQFLKIAPTRKDIISTMKRLNLL
jgi:uncharacterized protein